MVEIPPLGKLHFSFSSYPLLLFFLIFFLILDRLEFLDTHALGDLLQLDLRVLGLDLSRKELLEFLELV